MSKKLLMNNTSKIHYVEYIESTGTQYIDTNYYCTYGYKYELQFQDDTFKAYENYFGTDSACTRFLRASNNTGLIFCYGGDKTFSPTPNIDFTKKTKIYIDDNKVYLDDVLVYTANANLSRDKFGLTLLIFHGRYAVRLDKTGIFKLYRFKVWDDNSNLVFDFRPCLDDNNVPCLYEEVTKQYFHNSGTGTFEYKE